LQVMRRDRRPSGSREAAIECVAVAPCHPRIALPFLLYRNSVLYTCKVITDLISKTNAGPVWNHRRANCATRPPSLNACFFALPPATPVNSRGKSRPPLSAPVSACVVSHLQSTRKRLTAFGYLTSLGGPSRGHSICRAGQESTLPEISSAISSIIAKRLTT